MDIITGYVGKAHVTAEQDRDINQGIVGSGSYVLRTGMEMAAEVSSNNEIKIRDGVLMHQGCAASIKKNTYDSLTIVNGSQGMKRIDLIVARYSRSKDTGVESLKLIVIQGTPTTGTATVPSYTKGDIQAGDYVADMPMYQVILNGLNITEVKKVFETAPNLAEINSKIEYQLTPSWSNPTYKIYRRNGVVYINYYCGVSGGQAATAYKVATLPSGIAPTNTIKSQAWCANSDGKRYSASIEIQPSGVIKFVAGNVFVEAGFTVSYLL